MINKYKKTLCLLWSFAPWQFKSAFSIEAAYVQIHVHPLQCGSMRPQIVLSHYQIAPLLEARRAGEASGRTSVDLGMTECGVELNSYGAVFPGGEGLAWEALEEIAVDENACYRVEGREAYAIRAYSEFTARAYGLYPTPGAPTMLISGLPMHRIKDTTPDRDTRSKINAVAPVKGRVLDTATGLGYTAIAAAETAAQVVTIELDPTALQIARQNPWSQGLFDNPRVQQVVGDTFEEIAQFADQFFDLIIHDPPVVSLAGDLYSAAFYNQARRVLQPGGRMFHYIGDPDSKSGAQTTRGVVRRLREAGFSKVVPRRRAFGVVAYK
jgi:predicted methyltransferase